MASAAIPAVAAAFLTIMDASFRNVPTKFWKTVFWKTVFWKIVFWRTVFWIGSRAEPSPHDPGQSRKARSE
jgi:hypothetical protein